MHRPANSHCRPDFVGLLLSGARKTRPSRRSDAKRRKATQSDAKRRKATRSDAKRRGCRRRKVDRPPGRARGGRGRARRGSGPESTASRLSPNGAETSRTEACHFRARICEQNSRKATTRTSRASTTGSSKCAKATLGRTRATSPTNPTQSGPPKNCGSCAPRNRCSARPCLTSCTRKAWTRTSEKRCGSATRAHSA